MNKFEDVALTDVADLLYSNNWIIRLFGEYIEYVSDKLYRKI